MPVTDLGLREILVNKYWRLGLLAALLFGGCAAQTFNANDSNPNSGDAAKQNSRNSRFGTVSFEYSAQGVIEKTNR